MDNAESKKLVSQIAMRKLMDDVAEFNVAVGQPPSRRPTVSTLNAVRLRTWLIREEFDELIEASGLIQDKNGDIGGLDLEKSADAIADLIYVCIGAALDYGIPLDRVFAEVHRSNMTKIGADGHVGYRADGKVIKGPGYSPPNIHAAIYGDGQ
jgi:predicted HAD superfamily Cof-like phosphohydrolase